MKILYLSTLCSSKVLDDVFKTAIVKPRQPAQKFHSLIARGIGKYPELASITTLSVVPVIPATHKKIFWNLKDEFSQGVKYTYIPMLNLKFIKNIGVFNYTFLKVFFWTLFKSRKSTTIICDYLNVSIAAASLLACKITRTKIVAIATDIPGMMVTGTVGKTSLFKKTYRSINNQMLTRYSGYIILTKFMNVKINPKNKPSMVMEGLVDLDMKTSKNELNEKASKKNIIYAGGLYERYGIKTLIEAFMLLEDKDVRLHLYGNGPMVDDIIAYEKKDKRVVFKGMVPNTVVVEDQLKATLVVNPRPSTEELTRYSFPSKNMEYMVSGTPMITTHLPGMPDEYLGYVKLFRDESVMGMFTTLKEVLSETKEELHAFGKKSKKFVLENKNNEHQAKRIIDFLHSF